MRRLLALIAAVFALAGVTAGEALADPPTPDPGWGSDPPCE
jgi:hypothetical protein